MAEQRRDMQFLSSLKRHFRHKDQDYLVKITPAHIEEKTGTEKKYWLMCNYRARYAIMPR